MKRDQNMTSLSRILQQDASKVHEWIEHTNAQEGNLTKEFNWLGLADAAGFKARQKIDLAWAKIAVSIYERLAKEMSSDESDSFMPSAMMLRAFMIVKLGNLPGDPILDVEQLVAWFFEGLDVSYEEALTLSTLWRNLSNTEREILTSEMSIQVDYDGAQRTLSINDLRRLRRVKTRLAILQHVVEGGSLKPDSQLSAWLACREDLP